ncbi:2-oxoglutarate and iron-dependent oxygenase JMJD4 [Spea bombifrons]|uniref:2-oxoglutarate and iron-dependent oxygenase JMJD4 n=1 Tax=Spea bombifrons TaxID=233779 RepID=UPI0023494331|nr:2-oxoglutarate and iron-dependent oxygenase JMJD4 [Spea bombifrons]XP_053324316.1 2-oxoglutarate and iron-dependent oxygenase JMJD4 [Spea bombifrons]
MDTKLPEKPQICPRGSRQIDFIEDPESFAYSDFFHQYLLTNTPCLFSAKFTESWGCRGDWVTSGGRPDWDHLLQNFGDAVVPVANCGIKEYNSNPKERIPLREYIRYWRDYSENGCRSPRGCLYLKDWHMRREFPDRAVYSTPEYFSSDWLNEYWDFIDGDDYRFVYMGPKGSWTPFHADVFRSFSWSANVCGRKKWLLFPPGQEEHLRDRHGNLPYDVTSAPLHDLSLYPNAHKCCSPLSVIQEPGQMIFVPSGWHHQVYNLEDTISINHNWVNGCNVLLMWKFLQGELEAVHAEIGEWEDTMEDWHGHCQVIMKSCTGIDYKEFYSFIKIIAENRIGVLQNSSEERKKALSEESSAGCDPTLPGPPHAAFDLKKAAEILTLMLADDDFQKLDKEPLSPRPDELMQRLKTYA